MKTSAPVVAAALGAGVIVVLGTAARAVLMAGQWAWEFVASVAGAALWVARLAPYITAIMWWRWREAYWSRIARRESQNPILETLVRFQMEQQGFEYCPASIKARDCFARRRLWIWRALRVLK